MGGRREGGNAVVDNLFCLQASLLHWMRRISNIPGCMPAPIQRLDAPGEVLSNQGWAPRDVRLGGQIMVGPPGRCAVPRAPSSSFAPRAYIQLDPVAESESIPLPNLHFTLYLESCNNQFYHSLPAINKFAPLRLFSTPKSALSLRIAEPLIRDASMNPA